MTLTMLMMFLITYADGDGDDDGGGVGDAGDDALARVPIKHSCSFYC